ncbi:MAG: HAMP domain-containing histidine kinase [Deltaproteobacteria bacterium]|nr:HAMP domain-containing histidine kinase [Deltaproteobacteria bacterium]
MIERRIYGDGAEAAKTAFAPAERATRAEVEAAIAGFVEQPLLRALLDATSSSVLVLNRERQILVGNAVLMATFGVDDVRRIEGLRPGEALGCIHAWACPGGCGTAPQCSVCGAVLAVLESQQTGACVERECLLTVQRGDRIEAHELSVRASQLEIGGRTYTIVGLTDVGPERRRSALERVFLHDISNTIGALVNLSRVIAAVAPPDLGDASRRLEVLTHRLQREISDHRVLNQAENGTLEVACAPVEPAAVLETAAELLADHPVARNRRLEVLPRDGLPRVVSDESLLVRILVNMMKNALEATPEGGTVRAWAEPASPGPGCVWSVWSERPIEPRVALQIFKRSFSTKPGRGRGLGTFSMKLIGERYLGGAVGFTSDTDTGTTFTIRLPP